MDRGLELFRQASEDSSGSDGALTAIEGLRLFRQASEGSEAEAALPPVDWRAWLDSSPASAAGIEPRTRESVEGVRRRELRGALQPPGSLLRSRTATGGAPEPPPAGPALRRGVSSSMSGLSSDALSVCERAARRWARRAKRELKARRQREGRAALRHAQENNLAAEARLRQQGRLPEKGFREHGRSQTFLLGRRFIIYARTGDALRLQRALEPPPPADLSFSVRSRVAMCVINRFEPLPPKALHQLRASLSAGAIRVLEEPNAGGSSENSEAISLAMLETCFGATLLKTEMGLQYRQDNAKKIDYLALVAGRTVGVSVSRAMKYEDAGSFSESDARRLLVKKLSGLLDARDGVCPADRWEVDFLHIWCQTDGVAAVVAEVYERLPEEVTADTVVLLTTCSHIEHIIFDNRDFQQPPRPRARSLGDSGSEAGSAGAGAESGGESDSSTGGPSREALQAAREGARHRLHAQQREEALKWQLMMPRAAPRPSKPPERLRYFLS